LRRLEPWGLELLTSVEKSFVSNINLFVSVIKPIVLTVVDRKFKFCAERLRVV